MYSFLTFLRAYLKLLFCCLFLLGYSSFQPNLILLPLVTKYMPPNQNSLWLKVLKLYLPPALLFNLNSSPTKKNIPKQNRTKTSFGLPCWRSGWESACQCRGHGFEPWSGKIPHAAEQLGPWATTTEPARLETVLRNKRGRDSERPTHRDEEWPTLAATRESPRTETKTQHSHK